MAILAREVLKIHPCSIIEGSSHIPRVIHHDSKHSNIFLKANLEVKIGDFGLAVNIRRNQYLRECCGTPDYMALEVMSRRDYGLKADC